MRVYKICFIALLLVIIFIFGCQMAVEDEDNEDTVDTTVPTVISTNPVDGTTDVAINRNINATFSEVMDNATISITTFTLKQGSTPVPCVVTYVGTVATLNPSSNLTSDVSYDATITTEAKDLAGNALVINKTWSFTTGSATDSTPPTVLSTIPVDGTTDVVLNKDITAIFSEPMDAPSITETTFTLTQGVTPIPCTVTYASNVATLYPTSNLTANTEYTATITTGVKDLANNSLATNKVWSFTTGTTVAKILAPVNLGTAGDFVILTKTGITTTGTTSIIGNIGVSPAAATYMEGFGLIADPSNTFSRSSLVTGKVYAANYEVPTPSYMTTSVNNMETAYTDAAGRSLPDFTELYSGDISGKTLVPGLYKWSSGVLINSDVTLNGGPNDVWIFQISGDLTVASAAKVLLSGGAVPKNIFWQSFGAVALNTTSHLEGVVLSKTEVTMANGATINGRLLSQTAVTLIANSVVAP